MLSLLLKALFNEGFDLCFFYAWPHEVSGLLVKDTMALVMAFLSAFVMHVLGLLL
jgi:hypothetical protein